MGFEQNIKLNKIDKDGQLNIDFDTTIENNNPDKIEDDEALQKERINISNQYHILKPEELEKREDGNWYFHGIEVKKDAEMMSWNDTDDLYGKYKNIGNNAAYVPKVEINPITKKQEMSKSKSKYKLKNEPRRAFDPYK